jgi:indolepyruvate ferredoxin oxidoreductase beta subunit
MKNDIIIAGVGGQGILSIASIIDLAAIKMNYFIKQSEVHGMSQRGGAVQSHLRISSSPIFSDLIEPGQANMIISTEPLEALRYLNYLNPDGMVVTSTNFFKNIPQYPDETLILSELNKLKNVVMIDAENIAKTCGNIKAANMVILGAASPFLQLPQSLFEQCITEIFQKKGPEVVNLNIKAFKQGIISSQKL